MKYLIVFALLFNALIATGEDVNRKICIAGFERLVILSNADTISGTELAEAAIIADSLVRNKCYEYKVDRRGTVYAGASLPYLFGKICGIKNDTTAINAYLHFIATNNDSVATDEVDYALEELFQWMPQLFIQHVLQDGQHDDFLQRIAWGFLNNVYPANGALSIATYKLVFDKRYPSLRNVRGVDQAVLAKLFAEIEEIIR